MEKLHQELLLFETTLISIEKVSSPIFLPTHLVKLDVESFFVVSFNGEKKGFSHKKREKD